MVRKITFVTPPQNEWRAGRPVNGLYGTRQRKLSIVIDDFGYRPKEENQVLQMPKNISVAVLPNATHAREMATKAHQLGHEVLIHLPMAPLSKQPLEKDTLRPNMSSAEIARIIREAVADVPLRSA